MKFNILFAIAFASLASCTNLKKKNSLEKEGVKGSVSQITTTTYNAVEKFGEIMKGRVKSSIVDKYDRDGYNTEIDRAFFYDYSSPSRLKVSMQYNDKHQQISYTGLGTDDKLKGVLKYDQDGNVAGVENYNENKLVSKEKIVCDDKGLERDIYDYNVNGRLTRKSSVKRDNEGRATEVVVYDSTGVVDHTQTIVYDKDGLPANEKISGKYGGITTYKHSRIDEHGNWLTRVVYYDGKLSSITERKIVYY